LGIELLVNNVQLFLLVLFRTVAMFETAPLFSSSGIPQTVKIGFAFFTASTVFPSVLQGKYPIPSDPVAYFLLILGEVAIGLVIGFLLQLIFTAFQTAGHFFSLQMGFGASEVFDPLAQIEIPLMGELLNLIALLVFIVISGAGKFLFLGVERSFQYIRAVDLVLQKDALVKTLVQGLSGLFQTALTISFPILGTLTLISITMGLLAKAAPQMDVLTMGFPLSIGVAFIVLFAALPFMMTAFGTIIDGGFQTIAAMIVQLGGAKK
jgi:flagellar biosynthetic protein FliR